MAENHWGPLQRELTLTVTDDAARSCRSPIGKAMRTFVAKPKDAVEARKWWVIDAKNQPLGRLASRVATLLRGKHKPTFTPHVDTGDFVIVVNAAQVKVTGNKADKKLYYRHSGYPGGITAADLQRPARREAGRPAHPGGAGHAAEERARPPAAQEAQGVRDGAASPRRAAAPGAHALIRRNSQPHHSADAALFPEQPMPEATAHYATGKRKTADRPGLAQRRATARSSSTASRSTSTSSARRRAWSCASRSSARADRQVRRRAPRVAGGGHSAQAEAMRHGIARALLAEDPERRRVAEEGGLPDPRRSQEGAQEVRSARRPQALPVLEALMPTRRPFAEAERWRDP